MNIHTKKALILEYRRMKLTRPEIAEKLQCTNQVITNYCIQDKAFEHEYKYAQHRFDTMFEEFLSTSDEGEKLEMVRTIGAVLPLYKALGETTMLNGMLDTVLDRLKHVDRHIILDALFRGRKDLSTILTHDLSFPETPEPDEVLIQWLKSPDTQSFMDRIDLNSFVPSEFYFTLSQYYESMSHKFKAAHSDKDKTDAISEYRHSIDLLSSLVDSFNGPKFMKPILRHFSLMSITHVAPLFALVSQHLTKVALD